MNTSCIFCSIVANTIPATKIYEDDYILAFLDAHPLHAGHTLVIPKQHHETILDTPEQTLHQIVSGVQKISYGIVAGLHADGVNVSQNNKKAAGQVVPHIHFHVIPRYIDDGYIPWKRTKPVAENLQEVAQKIIQAL